MVTLGPMKFGGGTSRLHLDSSYGAAALSTTQTSSSSSSSSTSSSLSSLRCKMHNNFAAVILGRDLLDTQRSAGGGSTTTTPKPHHRPPNGKERDLSSSSRSPKSSNGSGLVHNSGGSGTYSHAFDVEHTSRCRNVTNHLPISSPGSPAQYRRLESRRVLVPEESPKRQLPFNPGMTRKTAVTPRACRKAVVTEVRTDQARVVHQVNKTTTAVGRSTNGLPKFHLNEQPSAAGLPANSTNKCRSINCKSSGMGAHNRLGGGVDKRDTSQPRTSLTGHTISSMNKIVKSSMSSSNTSRDTSIESIVPKYKTMGQTSGGQSSGQLSPRSAAEELGVSSPQKRSYNPQMLVRTNKFILNDEKVVSRKTSVVIPRIRSSLNESAKSKCGGITHNIPIYRDLEEKVSVVPTQASNGTGNAFISKVMKENRPTTTAMVGCRAEEHDQRVPDKSARSLLNNHRRPLYDDCDRDFFNRDPSNESLYIDFSKKRSPMTTTKTNGRSYGCDVHLSPLRPINKDVLLQRGVESAAVTCDYTYQFEAARKQRVEQSGVGLAARNNNSNSERLAKVLPSVFYVSCASWVPKCNNKFSLRERRLLEESKTISRKR